ncbi:uncharacterized protein AC631_03146 [Debaryomyces fabryi]|uniref:Uncharacterized protein n=1 Tax=Debaryomyces fabryi TaxID=58627 RepID=A0A0V1PY21_9ASCO|nr:uncharacterized protein AC631_03146 [Debaryomyces fabryi]KSA01078.1 hypothetical protein AC631_03146 [Debaryomyces fabryi]CUM48930.1 unnamed protein product [Debaryomyces fabryi]
MSLAILHSDTTQAFQSLSLSIPVDTAKYKKMYLFLSKVLNVSDENVILETEEQGRQYILNKEPIEVLSRVYLPHDTWLKGEVTIKDIKIKSNMLLEINNMIEKELPRTIDEVVQIDDNVLNYYEKLLTAFKVYEIPCNDTESRHNSIDDSLREEEEEEDTSIYDSNEISRTQTNVSTASLKTRLSIFNGYSSRRNSSMSTKKRILSNAGQANDNDVNSMLNSSGPIKNEEERKQGLNNILAKSRIYNKLKKHRLTGSVTSNISSPSSTPYSNRNSIGTTMTNNSYNSKRRGSSSLASPEITEGRILNIPSPKENQPIILTSVQKLENQRDKFEYYSQMKRLKFLTRRVIKHLDHSQESYDLVKILEFVNKCVVKFIFIDISQMIILYGQRKAYNFHHKH